MRQSHNFHQQLLNNINHNRHTLIVSPRRYGKTSLVHQVLRENKIIFAYTHFFNAVTDEIIVHRMTNSIAKLISELMPFSKKALKLLSSIILNSAVKSVARGANVLNIGVFSVQF